MKLGMRTPSLKKTISARTIGRAKRVIKKHSFPNTEKRNVVDQKS